MANTRPSTQKRDSDIALDTAMQKGVEFGHDIKQKHWTRGERGFSNACLNCGRVIGVLNTGDLWGTALNGSCPDQRWHAVSKTTRREASPVASSGDVTEVEPSKHQTIKGLVLFLCLLAIPLIVISVLVHFQLLSGFLVILARIGLTISAILLIVAVFRRAGIRPVLLMFGFSICLALLSVWFMSPEQRSDWQAKEKSAQKIKDERKAQKTIQPVQPQENEAPNQSASAENTTPVNMIAVFGGLYTQSLRKNGRDVTVYDGDSHTLLVDCTRELDPRTTCYFLYKNFPPAGDARLLRSYGITKVKYVTASGLFSGFAWEKELR